MLNNFLSDNVKNITYRRILVEINQLRDIRLNKTIYNIAGERLDRAGTQEDIKDILEAAYKDLGYDVEIRFSTPSETPELKGKGGTDYVGDDGKHTVIINSGYLNGKTKGEILGVISEEASHVINGAEGRQIATGTDEKGLESTGRATNEYFKDKYKDDDTTISLASDGAIDTSKLGTNVGDYGYYLGPKFSYGIGLKGGAGVGVYLINTGKGYDLGLGVTASFGANFSASASVGADYIYFPNATSKEHVSGDYESIEASITVKPGIGGSVGAVFYFPKENGKVNYSPSAKGFGIGLSGEVGVGASLPINIGGGKHTGTSWWKSFNGPVVSAISKIDNEIKQKNNLDLILKSSLDYIKNNQKKLKKKK